LQFLLLNGQPHSIDQPVFKSENRAFRYGDSIFESIRVIGGKPLFLEHHFDRLKKDALYLQIALREEFSIEFLNENIQKLLALNSIYNGGRIRLTVFRKEGGLYEPSDLSASFLLEATEAEDGFTYNSKGISIGIFEQVHKPLNRLSSIKSGSALLYVLASVYKKNTNKDDVLLLNESGNITESTNSNIFLVSSGKIYTPSLDEGCVAGVMRSVVIEMALGLGMKVYECSLRPDDLISADEIFLTNAISGLKWVGAFEQKRYYNKISGILFKALKNSIESSE
jgi:branched-subunit amino acid aminotransferase/4-amino-4-deoxychorismate lyase